MAEPRWDPTLPSQGRYEVIRGFSHLRNFVETGTANGAACATLAQSFDHLYTIELVPSIFAKAKARLAQYRNVECFLGDSTHVLPNVLAQLNGPAVFWLDGHYCGTEEARQAKDTPVEEELQLILGSRVPHAILIDDSRLFGNPDYPYPTVEWVRDLIDQQDIHYKFSYVDDIMRAIPAV